MDEQVCNARTGETFRRPSTAPKISEAEGIALTEAEAQKAATESGNELTLRQRADLALAALETEAGRDYTGLTAAQALQFLVPAVKLLCRVSIVLVRLTLRKLDSVQGTAKA